MLCHIQCCAKVSNIITSCIKSYHVKIFHTFAQQCILRHILCTNHWDKPCHNIDILLIHRYQVLHDRMLVCVSQADYEEVLAQCDELTELNEQLHQQKTEQQREAEEVAQRHQAELDQLHDEHIKLVINE